MEDDQDYHHPPDGDDEDDPTHENAPSSRGSQQLPNDMTQAETTTQEYYVQLVENRIHGFFEDRTSSNFDAARDALNEALSAYTELPSHYLSSAEIRRNLQSLSGDIIERRMSAERAKRSRLRRHRRYLWLELFNPVMMRLTKRATNCLRDSGEVVLPHLSVGATNELSGVSHTTFRLR